MAQIDITTIQTCDEANLALADVLETMENFDEAVEAAFTFATEVSRIKCKGGDGHRVVSSVLPIIRELLQAEGEATPKEFANALRTTVRERRRMVNEERESVTRFIMMIQRRGSS